MASPETLDPNDNDAILVYAPAGVFFVLCPLVAGLRTVARVRGGSGLGADDYTVFVALLFTQLMSAFLVASCHWGMGRHYSLLTPEEKRPTLMFFWLAQITYKAAINSCKACILFLYLRIFNNVRWFRLSCYALLAAVSAYTLAAILATIFQCWPVQRVYDKSLEGGHCNDNTQFWYANAGFSISTDIIILLLPMPLVWQLRVTLSRKLALAGIFTVGIFVVIASCLRITSLNILATSPDTTYDIVNVTWTIIEPNLGVVCVCLPLLRPFIVKLIPALRSKDYSASQYAPGTQANSNTTRRYRSQNQTSNHWVEIDDAHTADGIPMSRMQRHNSASAGSQDSILTPDAGTKPPLQIQKTMEYTVSYAADEVDGKGT